MSDTFTNTEHQASRYQAAHADRESAYDGEPFTQPRGPINPTFAAEMDRALVAAGRKFACSCGGAHWTVGARDECEASRG